MMPNAEPDTDVELGHGHFLEGTAGEILSPIRPEKAFRRFGVTKSLRMLRDARPQRGIAAGQDGRSRAGQSFGRRIRRHQLRGKRPKERGHPVQRRGDRRNPAGHRLEHRAMTLIRAAGGEEEDVGGAIVFGVGFFLALLTTQALSDQGIVFAVPWSTIVLFVIGTVVAGILAAVLPARRAARLNVLEALQYE